VRSIEEVHGPDRAVTPKTLLSWRWWLSLHPHDPKIVGSNPVRT